MPLIQNMERTPSSRSIRALVSRGFDSETAEHLVSQGFTISHLKSLQPAQLAEIGVPGSLASRILAEPRPPLRDSVVQKLLIESRFRCCMCHQPNKSLVIHHIEERSLSRDDSESNLAVLCVADHDEAHTTRVSGRKFTPDLIRAAKHNWIERGREESRELLLELSRTDGAIWDYVNHHRLYSLLRTAGIDPRGSPYASTLINAGLLDNLGILQDPSQGHSQGRYLYDFGSSTTLYLHTEWLLQALMRQIEVVDLFGRWSRSEIAAVVPPGTMVMCQGAFYFTNRSDQSAGRNQTRTALRRDNGVHLSFEFDAWESLSNSAYGSHLVGRSVVTAICLIREIELAPTRLKLSATCLAIGSCFPRVRMPTNLDWLRNAYTSVEEDEEDGGDLLASLPQLWESASTHGETPSEEDLPF
jgi:hypothetical protein